MESPVRRGSRRLELGRFPARNLFHTWVDFRTTPASLRHAAHIGGGTRLYTRHWVKILAFKWGNGHTMINRFMLPAELGACTAQTGFWGTDLEHDARIQPGLGHDPLVIAALTDEQGSLVNLPSMCTRLGARS